MGSAFESNGALMTKKMDHFQMKVEIQYRKETAANFLFEEYRQALRVNANKLQGGENTIETLAEIHSLAHNLMILADILQFK